MERSGKMGIFKKIFSLEESRFVLVGIMNTVIGTSAMFIAYNLFGMGYWSSSALNYIIGSIFSYFANKYFTFKSEKKSAKEIGRFVINIVVCYLVAYGIAGPVINIVLGNLKLSSSLLEQIGMFLGTCIFIVLNYCGQKFIVFTNKFE